VSESCALISKNRKAFSIDVHFQALPATQPSPSDVAIVVDDPGEAESQTDGGCHSL